MNRADRRAHAKRVVARFDPTRGKKASAADIRGARSTFAVMLKEKAEKAEEEKPEAGVIGPSRILTPPSGLVVPTADGWKPSTAHRTQKRG